MIVHLLVPLVFHVIAPGEAANESSSVTLPFSVTAFIKASPVLLPAESVALLLTTSGPVPNAEFEPKPQLARVKCQPAAVRVATMRLSVALPGAVLDDFSRPFP